ncbi:MAG: hypothetical protein ABSE95_06370 [Thermodesulfobacteriota bacterium]|jgi:predicted site-specific integrase-resolvase
MIQGWAKIKETAEYAGMSKRTLEDWLKNGILSYAQLTSGTRLIKLQWIDEARERFKVIPEENPVTRLVDDVMQEFSTNQ